MKNHSTKRIKELTDELQNEKRRVNELSKDKSEKEREIQILHAQLDSIQTKQVSTSTSQQSHQVLQVPIQRLTEENAQLRQQQEVTNAHAVSNGDGINIQLHVLNEQIKKLSVDNANLDKKANRYESLTDEIQKQKDDLTR
jgi:chromosome segregation ATPase